MEYFFASSCPAKAAHVCCPFAPGVERAFGLARNAGRAPDRQHRTADLAARRPVGLVMGKVGGAAGAIILAGRVDAARVLEEGAVMRERARVEGGQRLGL